MEGINVGMELRSLNNMIRRYFELSSHKKEIDSITGNNGWIIRYLDDHSDKDIYQKDIEETFKITRSTVSRVLSLMEQKGLIERRPVAQDARLKKIVLTEKAKGLRGLMCEDGRRMEQALIEGFSEEELARMAEYLRRMKENITNIQEKR